MLRPEISTTILTFVPCLVLGKFVSLFVCCFFFFFIVLYTCTFNSLYKLHVCYNVGKRADIWVKKNKVSLFVDRRLSSEEVCLKVFVNKAPPANSNAFPLSSCYRIHIFRKGVKLKTNKWANEYIPTLKTVIIRLTQRNFSLSVLMFQQCLSWSG